MHLLNTFKQLNDRSILALASGWTVLTTVLTLLPSGDEESLSFLKIPGLDKAGHFLFYLILSFLWCHVVRNRGSFKIVVFIFCLTFGIILEFLQFYLSLGRQYEILDMLVNAVGVGIGIVLYKININ